MAQVPIVLHTDKVLVGVFVFSGTKTCSYDVVDFIVTLGLGLRNLQLHGRDLVGFDIRADAKEFPVYLHKMGYGTTELSYAKNGEWRDWHFWDPFVHSLCLGRRYRSDQG